MFLTNVLMKKVKSKFIKVLLRSTGSSHERIMFRERTEDKMEEVFFDPFVEMLCVYKEEKKLHSKNPLPSINKNYKGVFKPKVV